MGVYGLVWTPTQILGASIYLYIMSIMSPLEPERAAEARSAVVASFYKKKRVKDNSHYWACRLNWVVCFVFVGFFGANLVITQSPLPPSHFMFKIMP